MGDVAAIFSSLDRALRVATLAMGSQGPAGFGDESCPPIVNLARGGAQGPHTRQRASTPPHVWPSSQKRVAIGDSESVGPRGIQRRRG